MGSCCSRTTTTTDDVDDRSDTPIHDEEPESLNSSSARTHGGRRSKKRKRSRRAKRSTEPSKDQQHSGEGGDGTDRYDDTHQRGDFEPGDGFGDDEGFSEGIQPTSYNSSRPRLHTNKYPGVGEHTPTGSDVTTPNGHSSPVTPAKKEQPQQKAENPLALPTKSIAENEDERRRSNGSNKSASVSTHGKSRSQTNSTQRSAEANSQSTTYTAETRATVDGALTHPGLTQSHGAHDGLHDLPLQDDHTLKYDFERSGREYSCSESETSSTASSARPFLASSPADLTRRVPGALFRKAVRIIAGEVLHDTLHHPLALKPQLLPDVIQEVSAEKMEKRSTFSLIQLQHRIRGLLNIKLSYLNKQFLKEVEDAKKAMPTAASKERTKTEGVSSPRLLMHKYDVVFGCAHAATFLLEKDDHPIPLNTSGSDGHVAASVPIATTAKTIVSIEQPTPPSTGLDEDRRTSAKFMQSVASTDSSNQRNSGGNHTFGALEYDENDLDNPNSRKVSTVSSLGASHLSQAPEPTTLSTTILFPSMLRKGKGTFEFDRECFTTMVTGDSDRAQFTKTFFLDLFINAADFEENPQQALISAMGNLQIRMHKVISRTGRVASSLSNGVMSTASGGVPFSMTVVYIRDDEVFSCNMGDASFTDAELLLVKDVQDHSAILLRGDMTTSPQRTSATAASPTNSGWTKDVFRVLLPHAATPDGSITSNFSYESLVSIGKERAKNRKVSASMASRTLTSTNSSVVQNQITRKPSGSLGVSSVSALSAKSQRQLSGNSNSSANMYIAQFTIVLSTAQFWSVFPTEEVWSFVNAMMQKFAEELMSITSLGSFMGKGAVAGRSTSTQGSTASGVSLHSEVQNLNYDMAFVLQQEAVRRLEEKGDVADTVAVTILTFM